jgi:hypothetical protein
MLQFDQFEKIDSLYEIHNYLIIKYLFNQGMNGMCIAMLIPNQTALKLTREIGDKDKA